MLKFPFMELRPLSLIKAHPDSCRRVEADKIYNLGKCYDLLGHLRVAIVVNNRTEHVIDGDNYVAMLRARNVEEVPVWVIDIDEAHEDLAHLALNNHCGEWIWERVSEQLKQLKAKNLPLEVTGFHPYDISPLVAAEWKPAEKGLLEGGDANQQSLL